MKIRLPVRIEASDFFGQLLLHAVRHIDQPLPDPLDQRQQSGRGPALGEGPERGVAAVEAAVEDRLRGAGRLLNWSRREIDAVVEAFHCIQRLRLDRQQRGQGPANLIAPEELNELERATLKEAFRQARKLQARLQIRYQL